jgi:hypothetical protein
MTEYESRIVELAPFNIESSVAGHPLPSPSHCVGTGKLLGALLGRSISEEFQIEERSFKKTITQLSCLLRSYIVIDDFMKDSGVALADFPDVELWLKNISDDCIKLISSYTSDSSELWCRYLDTYQKAYISFDYLWPFESVVKKCNLIFLPFEFEPVVLHHRRTEVLESLKHYLFALQLIDDFQDMEEDQKAPKNHNLFVAGLEKEMVSLVANARSIIVRSLFGYIRENLSRLQSCFLGETALSTLKHSLSWLCYKEKEHQSLPYIEVFVGEFHDYRFNVAKIRSALSMYGCVEVPCFEEIRAEKMHTLDVSLSQFYGMEKMLDES